MVILILKMDVHQDVRLKTDSTATEEALLAQILAMRNVVMDKITAT